MSKEMYGYYLIVDGEPFTFISMSKEGYYCSYGATFHQFYWQYLPPDWQSFMVIDGVTKKAICGTVKNYKNSGK